MNRRIRLTFPEGAFSAVAALREDAAPRTCDAIWNALPITGVVHHAIYSGSECVLILPKVLTPPSENATAEVRTGDIGFTWFDAGSAYGVTEPFAEICWFYDRDGRPSMPEGPVPVSLFARVEGDTDAFFAFCRRIRREGVKGMAVERVEAGRSALRHAVVFRPRHGAAVAPHAARLPSGAIAVAFTHVIDNLESDPRCLPLICRSSDGGAPWTGAVPIDGTRWVGWRVRALSATVTGGVCVGLEHAGTGKSTCLISRNDGTDWVPETTEAAEAAPEDNRLRWTERPPFVLTRDGAPVRVMPAPGPGTPCLLTGTGGPAVCIYAACDSDPAAPVPGVYGIHATIMDT